MKNNRGSYQDRQAKYISIKNSGIRISLLTIFSIIAIYTIYGYLVSPADVVISSNLMRSLSNLGLAILIFLVGALSGLSYGIYCICLSEKLRFPLLPLVEYEKRRLILVVLPEIVNIISQEKYLKLFILILIVYALFFSFISGMIIYIPTISFSQIYEISSIPSWLVIPCCSLPGFVPMFSLYLTDNLIIFIIPINLVLMLVLSTLVSTNITLALYSFENRLKNKNKKNYNKHSYFSGEIGGAAAGLFTACPTCAGTFFSTLVGIITGTSTTALISSGASATIPIVLQLLFISVSIGILIISPCLLIRKLRNRCIFT